MYYSIFFIITTFISCIATLPDHILSDISSELIHRDRLIKVIDREQNCLDRKEVVNVLQSIKKMIDGWQTLSQDTGLIEIDWVILDGSYNNISLHDGKKKLLKLAAGALVLSGVGLLFYNNPVTSTVNVHKIMEHSHQAVQAITSLPPATIVVNVPADTTSVDILYGATQIAKIIYR